MNTRQDKLTNIQDARVVKRFSIHSVISVPSVANIISVAFLDGFFSNA